MLMNVFTYGSLMFSPVWANVVGKVYSQQNARLYGYKRRKIKGEIYPAVIPGTDGDYVDGIIYLDVDDNDIGRLDMFEGACYHKKLRECVLEDQSKAMAYVYVFKKAYQYLIEDKEWDPDWFAKAGLRLFFSE